MVKESNKELGSICCPNCSSADSKVLEIRHNGYSWRRRQCLSCGTRFRTVEVLEEEFKALEATVRQLKKPNGVNLDAIKEMVVNLQKALTK